MSGYGPGPNEPWYVRWLFRAVMYVIVAVAWVHDMLKRKGGGE